MKFDHFVKEALAYTDHPGRTAISTKSTAQDAQNNILVLGLGSAGCSIVRRLNLMEGYPIHTLVADREKEYLEQSLSPTIFLLKSSYFPPSSFGLCGGNPDLIDLYSRAVENAWPDLASLTGSPGMCFIVAGMGGNMGTGAAPVIARMMKEKGTIVIALVTLPTSFEKSRRLRAEKGIKKLMKNTHATIVLDLNQLKAMLPDDLPFGHLYSIMDYIIASTLRGIIDTTHSTGEPLALIPFEYEDIRYILQNGVRGTILLGEIYCRDTIRMMDVDSLLYSLGPLHPADIKGAIIHITAGHDTCIFENDMLAQALTGDFNPHADVTWGVTVKREFDGRKRILAIVTTGGEHVVR
jgi:cell division protein FtsZ